MTIEDKQRTVATLKAAIQEYLLARNAHDSVAKQEIALRKKRKAYGRKVLEHFSNHDDLLLKVSNSLLLRIPGEWYDYGIDIEPGVEDLMTTDSYDAEEWFPDF